VTQGAQGKASSGHVIAIGDVHGCADELRELLGTLPIRKDTTIVMLGDYIDRGPKSNEVVKIVRELQEKHTVITLMGNHELMLLEFLESDDPLKEARFIYNGGTATLSSYADGQGGYLIPAEHMQFYTTLRPWYAPEGRFFFVHAGLPEVHIEDLDPTQHLRHALWARKEFLESEFPWKKIVVHGHSPVHSVEVSTRRINADTGCVYGGALSAVELPSLRVYSVQREAPGVPPRLVDGTQRQAVRFRGRIPLVMKTKAGDVKGETLDYSDIGLLARALDVNDKLYQLGEPIEGTLGDGETFEATFAGTVVRLSREPEGWCYGVALSELGDEPIERARGG
jgi:serine/threonine protein phosphatase 1